MKYAELSLPYFKQGDDLFFHLDRCETNKEALNDHASSLREAADMLDKLSEFSDEIEIDAETHHIGISGPDEIIDKLVESELLTESDFEFEDELCDCNCDIDK